MKINKQLFEDVLAGKLKGTFVLKNGKKFRDNQLTYIYKSTVVLGKTTFYFNGKPIVSDYNGILDIIDFIPDTIEIDPEMYSYNEKDMQFVKHFINSYHMKENELTIEIPNDKVIDWDESKKQNKIVLKDRQLTYGDVCKKLFKDDHYSIAWEGSTIKCCSAIYNASNATTERQLKCILAKNKLANVAVYLNDGWKPKEGEFYYYLDIDLYSHIVVDLSQFYNGVSRVLFKSEKLALQAIEILGEETVKFALEPLGI